LLISTQNKANVVFDFLPNNDVNILSREAIIIGESIDLDKYFLGKWYPGTKKNVALKFTHENDNDDLVFSERFVDLSDRWDDIKDPVPDWPTLVALANPEEGDIRFVENMGIFAEYKWFTKDYNEEDLPEGTDPAIDVLGWAEMSIGFQNEFFKYGREKVEEIHSAFSTPYGNKQSALVNQPGGMNAWKAKQQAFSPRLLLYTGNNNGANETDDYSLEWKKNGKGILEKEWPNWNRFLADALPATGSFDFPVNVLKSVIYNKCKKYRTAEGEFLIEEMRVRLRTHSISATEIQAYKVE